MDDEVRWGIIGSGDVAQHKGGPALYNVEGSRLVAVMSRRAEKAADFARRHGAERHYDSVEGQLADEEVNAVYVATPPASHLEITAAAARAGKHVLCEKPMAMSTGECEEMIRPCREGGVRLRIAYYRRFFPVVERMKDLVERGAIVEVVRARAQTANPYAPREGGERAWLKDPSVAGGGFMTDVGVHRLDLLVHFLGLPREVAAFVDTLSLDVAVDDSSSVLMRFENGGHATAEFNWNVGASIDEFELCGTEGRILCRGLDSGQMEVISGDSSESFRLSPPSITHLGLVNHFVRSLLSGGPNRLAGEDGMLATSITEAAHLSSREGRVVRPRLCPIRG
jgi:1,5-anhydro-D-fructose reductase (1,5-anhydro-D-mannitol-forming)